MTDLEKIEARRAEVAGQIRRYMDPFVKHDKGDIRSLKRDEDKLQGQLARSASEFLKSHGFKSSGDRRKKR